MPSIYAAVTYQYYFSCWDGKNLDSPNHKDHVAYPSTGPATFLSLGGTCPSTHPVRIPQLMYEVSIAGLHSKTRVFPWKLTLSSFTLLTGCLGYH